jgi:hypothetical protein
MNAPARHGISCAKVEALGLTTQGGIAQGAEAHGRDRFLRQVAAVPDIGRASSIGLGTQLSSWHRSL